MINKAVIQKFQESEGLDDWSWLKHVARHELEEELRIIDPDFQFKTEPWLHQLASFTVGIHNPCFLYFLDMGTGKTKLVLDLFAWYKRQEAFDGGLVVALNEVSVDTWAQDIEKHSDLTYLTLTGPIEKRWEKLENNSADLVIINYAGIMHMLSSKEENDKGKMEMVPDKSKIRAFRKLVGNAICLDEIHSIKNNKSLTYKLCNQLAKEMFLRYGLTGTPFGRDPIDFWAQFYMVDRGETLGTSIGVFREAFFKGTNNFWGGIDWKFDKSMESKLYKRLNHKSLRYSEDEVKELPAKVYCKLDISFDVDVYHDYYKKAIDGFIEAQKGNRVAIENAFCRLRQITSGYVNFKDDEDIKQTIIFDANPKLDMLLGILNSMPPTSKIVIFNEYTLTGDIIEKALKKEKIGYQRLYGGTKDKIGVKNKFNDDPKCKALLANTKSGGVALNLQVANYVVFYETPVSPIIRAQAEKRCHRGGQTKRVYIYDLVMRNSIDVKILTYLKEGKDLFDVLIDGKETVDVKANMERVSSKLIRKRIK